MRQITILGRFLSSAWVETCVTGHNFPWGKNAPAYSFPRRKKRPAHSFPTQSVPPPPPNNFQKS